MVPLFLLLLFISLSRASSGVYKSGLFSKAYPWPNNTVYYLFDPESDYNETEKARFRQALDVLRENTCIQFIEGPTTKHYIKVFKDAKRCTSSVGFANPHKDPKITHQVMNLAAWCLNVNETRLALPRGATNYTTPYDYNSFMHANRNTDGNFQNPHIMPKDRRYIKAMGSVQGTFYDFHAVNLFHKCYDKCPPDTSTKCSNGGMPHWNDCQKCLCPSGFGGKLCDERQPEISSFVSTASAMSGVKGPVKSKGKGAAKAKPAKAASARPNSKLATVTETETSQKKTNLARRKASNKAGAKPKKAGTVQEPSANDKERSEPKDILLAKKSSIAMATCAEDEEKKTAKTPLKKDDKKKEEKPEKKKPAKTPKQPESISPAAETAVQEFVDYHTNIAKVSEEWEMLATQTVMEEQKHKACCENKERNRYPEEVHCLDATRVIIKTATGEEGEFYDANKCRFEGGDRDYIVAQAPMQNTAEAFWKLVFQEQSPTIVMLCDFYENGKEASMPFYPTKMGEYKYYGTMFINNKKKETTDKMTAYTIEVLPDGCSNSLITVIYHYVLWPPGRGTRASQLLDMRRLFKAGEAGPMTVVSSRGTGRATAFVAIDVILIRLFKGIRTRLVDTVQQMRKQRSGSLNCMFHYFDIIDIVLHYLQAKVKKHRDAVQKYRQAVHTQLKKCDTEEKKEEGKCCNKDEKMTAEDPSSCG